MKSIAALEDRLIHFAVAVLKLVNKLPKNPGAQHLASQIMRSGTSPGLHYGEARSAESRADFRHKVKIVHKELRETHNALRIIHLMKYVDDAVINSVLNESNELVAIFTATLRKLDAKKN